jgi:hypothetical protein
MQTPGGVCQVLAASNSGGASAHPQQHSPMQECAPVDVNRSVAHIALENTVLSCCIA